jgi:hypothetical protein
MAGLVSLRHGSEEESCTAVPVPYVCPDVKREKGPPPHWEGLVHRVLGSVETSGASISFGLPGSSGMVLSVLGPWTSGLRFVMFPRGIVAALSLSVFVVCQVRDSSRRTGSAAAAGADSAPTTSPPISP